MSEATGTGRMTLRWVTIFMAGVWAVNFVACASTQGMVPDTVANIRRATDQLGDFSWVGAVITYAASIVLGLAALGFYGAVWSAWIRHFPERVSEPTQAGPAIALRLAGGAQVRVCMHYGVVLFATSNYPAWGPVGLLTQALAAISVVVACIMMIRAGRLAGPPYTDLWLAAALVVIAGLGVEAWVVIQAGVP